MFNKRKKKLSKIAEVKEMLDMQSEYLDTLEKHTMTLVEQKNKLLEAVRGMIDDYYCECYSHNGVRVVCSRCRAKEILDSIK